MTDLFKTTLNYSNSGLADWIREIDWYLIPIREIAGIEGKRQTRYCPLENVVELAPDDDFPVLFGSFILELRHARQRRKFGLILYCLLLGLFRSRMEKSAEKMRSLTLLNGQTISEWKHGGKINGNGS